MEQYWRVKQPRFGMKSPFQQISDWRQVNLMKGSTDYIGFFRDGNWGSFSSLILAQRFLYVGAFDFDHILAFTRLLFSWLTCYSRAVALQHAFLYYYFNHDYGTTKNPIDNKGKRSELIVMERDPNAKKNGYTAVSYCNALKKDSSQLQTTTTTTSSYSCKTTPQFIRATKRRTGSKNMG